MNLKKIIEEWQKARAKVGTGLTSEAILLDYKYDYVNLMVQALEEAIDLIKRTSRGDCYCEVAIGNPNMTSHSSNCKDIIKWLGKFES